MYLCDCLAYPDDNLQLPSTIEIQLSVIYRDAVKDKTPGCHITLCATAEKGYDCGLFAIAFAYHMARGDDVTKIRFNQSMMRQHLTKCFKSQELSPFPALAEGNQ